MQVVRQHEVTTAPRSAGIRSPTYAPPALTEIGGLAELTLTGCYFGKHLGGSDGFTFMGISVPISNCSQ